MLPITADSFEDCCTSSLLNGACVGMFEAKSPVSIRLGDEAVERNGEDGCENGVPDGLLSYLSGRTCPHKGQESTSPSRETSCSLQKSHVVSVLGDWDFLFRFAGTVSRSWRPGLASSIKADP